MGWIDGFQRDGLVILQGLFSSDQVAAITASLTRILTESARDTTAIRGEEGNIYAARNVLELWVEANEIWRQSPLPEALEAVLGRHYGLVRGLYFDKPPGATWALPWHKDLTIAVQDNRLPSTQFVKPTVKAGVPHVEAPRDVLERMVTARLHLDDMTEENGPLKVIPGSHAAGKAAADGSTLPRTVLARRGDVLLIRPLVEHCSGRPHPATRQHRRILHLEFAASPDLPDGYCWHTYCAGSMN
jgi:ectoine hydroxylase-related dioxygenase (phytanoyl-CoA dioxygenase family)